MSKIHQCESQISNDLQRFLKYIIIGGAIILVLATLVILYQAHQRNKKAAYVQGLATNIEVLYAARRLGTSPEAVLAMEQQQQQRA